ncbi:hypothetical protein KGM_211212 [Danaus plexippus plexippus]|uniref:Uncharacterized protein n=1 Tax=Danaus plexippus plexippus TaxID=278856 RepID=A0A212EK96_DANPL|nr:hypothetical protein KGM_211212 [Danaus plexippus plexippus]
MTVVFFVASGRRRGAGSESFIIHTTPMLIARREYPYHRWEPLYFGTQNEPWYNEVLSWEGKQDKMAQTLSALQRPATSSTDGHWTPRPIQLPHTLSDVTTSVLSREALIASSSVVPGQRRSATLYP